MQRLGSKASRVAAPVLLVVLTTGCGDKGGGGGGGSPAPACELKPAKAVVQAGETTDFTVSANFAPTKVQVDDTVVLDESVKLDLSKEKQAAQPPAPGAFVRTYALRVDGSKSVEAHVTGAGTEARCLAEIKAEGDAVGVIDSGDGRLVLGLTSTAVGGGKRQAVVHCRITNYLDYEPSSGTRILKQQGSETAQCDLAVPEGELATTENWAPSPWLAGGLREKQHPKASDFSVTISDGDTTDSNFSFGWSSFNWPEDGFVRYSDCHTAKVQTEYRRSDFTLEKAVITWERRLDPLSQKMIWRLKDGEPRPRGVNIRGAYPGRFDTFFYCDWQHAPAEMVVASSRVQASDEGAFKPTAEMRFDVDLRIDAAIVAQKRGLTLQEFRSVLSAAAVDSGNAVESLVTVRSGDGSVVATNDASLAQSSPESAAKWSKDCEGKVTTSVKLLADGQSRELPGNEGAFKVTLKLCDFKDLLLSDLKAVGVEAPANEHRQVIFKCNLKDTSSSYLFYSDGKTECGFGTPPGSAGEENRIPTVYADGGTRAQLKPWIEGVHLKKRDTNASDWTVELYNSNLQFSWLPRCRAMQLVIPLKGSGSANVAYRRILDDSTIAGEAQKKMRWDRLTPPPSSDQINGDPGATLTAYFFCGWDVAEFGDSVPVQ